LAPWGHTPRVVAWLIPNNLPRRYIGYHIKFGHSSSYVGSPEKFDSSGVWGVTNPLKTCPSRRSYNAKFGHSRSYGMDVCKGPITLGVPGPHPLGWGQAPKNLPYTVCNGESCCYPSKDRSILYGGLRVPWGLTFLNLTQTHRN